MATPRRALRLYEKDKDTGVLYDLEVELEIDEHLGGTIPNAGDYIVSQWVIQGRDRREVENRTIYDVISRYFFAVEAEEWNRPGGTKELLQYVGALVVKERPAVEAERDIACRT